MPRSDILFTSKPKKSPLIYDPTFNRVVYPDNFHVEPCDIFFTRGDALFSYLIRLGEKHPGDLISIINHTGIVVESGSLYNADVIEALIKVRKHSIWSQYHGKSDQVAIFRPRDLSINQKDKIVQKALSYEGRKYGWLKIGTHTADYFLGGLYVFRRLTDDDDYPICSWVVAHSYAEAGLTFGCAPGEANPDDIWDYCIEHPEKYQLIFSLQQV